MGNSSSLEASSYEQNLLDSFSIWWYTFILYKLFFLFSSKDEHSNETFSTDSDSIVSKMLASDNNNVSSFRWELVDLKKQRDDVNKNPYGLTSNNFSLQTRSSIQFALFVFPPYNPKLRSKNAVGVILKQFDNKPFEASVKLWIESSEGRKFGEIFIEKHVFDKIDDFCGYKGLFFDEEKAFYELANNHETFYICCKIFDLSKLPDTNCDQVFLQNQWNLYENDDFCDAVVKIAEKEFKVSKFVFGSQSQIFKSMFESKFKEGITSTIEVKDVEEETMKHLIKWLYTSKLEDDAPIEKLFAAADKYDIKLLKTTCVQLMVDSMSEANAFSRLVLASVHNDNELKSGALDFISKLSQRSLADVLMSDECIQLSNKNQAMANEVKELIRNKLN